MKLLLTLEFRLPENRPSDNYVPDDRRSVAGKADDTSERLCEEPPRLGFRFPASRLTAFLCAFALGSAVCAADGPYYTDRTADLPIAGISAGAAGPTMDVAVGDLNGDGFPDIVLAHEFEPNVILFNDGTGKFTNVTASRLPQVRQDSEDIAIADFDKDGDPDLVFVTEDDISHITGIPRMHEYYLNDGEGKFTAASYTLPDSKANAVAVADFNDDGFPDLVIGNDGQNYLLINDKNGGFIDETKTRLPEIWDTTQDVKIADFDRDGDPDLMMGNEDRNRLLINNGQGVFADESMDRLPQNVNLETRKVTVEDINGDGAPDIFLSNVAWRDHKIVRNRLYINNGSGVFTDETASRLPEDNEFTLDAIFTDADLDGDRDIVTVNIQQLPYKVYLNNGNGVFSEPTQNILPAVYTGAGLTVLAADINGDGIEDLYFGNRDRKDNLLIHTDNPTGMIDPTPALPEELRLFPNPCRESVTLQYAGTSGEISSVEIFSQLGQCMHSCEAQTDGEQSMTLPVEHLPSGVYTMRIQAGDDWSTHCFVKE